ncbi:phosphonopyruvate decarboxylase [Saccharopolyspora sp. 5N102]|uniref:phosphonopyruvate decarboxylase n=1 Tax=Saccharopolyspora sp. 5N102 TaxID=3375155 RepID=UPI003789E5CF
MIPAELFCDELAKRGFTVASGVPCSFFGGPIALLSQTPGSYVPAANEGAALATAAGVALAGGRAYVMLQNSGLGNLVNPLTSLVMTYRIPVLTFVSLRGWPDPADDEPQHEIMGTITQPVMELLDLPHWRLGADDGADRFAEILGAAESALDEGKAPFVLVEKGAVGKISSSVEPVDEDRLDSAEVVRLISKLADGDPVVATTGYTGRELFGIDDRPRNFYMQGSMGHASSIALGVAMVQPDRTVVALDGDGAVLMHMGTLSAIGDQSPANLVHVVLDNGIHESTGGQRTTSTGTRIEEVAAAAGYREVFRCHSLDDVRALFEQARSTPGPHLMLIPTKRRTGAIPPRATNTHSPETIRDRFTAALRAGELNSK